MVPIVLVENERTAGGQYDHWQDATGERYQFPNQYKNKVLAGRRFVYYRGARRADGSRGIPEYFGHGVIGEVAADPENAPEGRKASWKWVADIDDYWPFPKPVAFKKDGVPYEDIPQNFWGVGVREISEETYATILGDSGLSVGVPGTATLAAGGPIEPLQAEASLLVGRRRHPGVGGVGSTAGVARRSKYSVAVGNLGESAALDYLRLSLPERHAASLRWTAQEGETPGWDIEYRDDAGQLVAVEVKATTGPRFPAVELTANEWAAATKLRGQYRLVLVANVLSCHR